MAWNEKTYETRKKEAQLSGVHLQEFVDAELGGNVELLQFLTGKSKKTCENWLNGKTKCSEAGSIYFVFPEYDMDWLEGLSERRKGRDELQYIRVKRPMDSWEHLCAAKRNYCRARVAFDYYLRDRNEAAKERAKNATDARA